METQTAIGLCREVLGLTLQLSLPILATLLAVGLILGFLQTATQIQEQTLPVVAKLVLGAAALAWFLPWMTVRMVEYSRNLFEQIPETLGPFL